MDYINYHSITIVRRFQRLTGLAGVLGNRMVRESFSKS
jgi:hypothetical protein